MDSCKDECCNRIIKDCKVKTCEEEEIAKLKRKIDSLSDVVAQRNELREQCQKNERWMKNSENEHQKVFSELLNTFNIQTEKLKKVMSIESKLQDKHNALQECYNRIANELKTAKLNENKLQCNLDECERNRKSLEKELVCIKKELEERKCDIKQLNKKLKCVEEEMCKVRKEINEYKRERNQLNDAIEKLETELKCTKSKLVEVECNAMRMEETLKNKLCEMEKRYEEASCKITNGKQKIKILTTSLKELKEASEKSHYELKNQINKLKEENYCKVDEICNLKQKINELQRENEFNVIDMFGQKNKTCPLIKPKCNSCCFIEKPTTTTYCTNSITSASEIFCNLPKRTKSISHKYTSKGCGTYSCLDL